MISPFLRSLINAPLADPTKINLPGGRTPAPRGKKLQEYADETDGGLRITKAQARERKTKAQADKLSKMFDYYAATDLSAERVAEHLGLYKNEQTGTDKLGKPVFSKVLDVKRAASELAWRRKAA